MSWIGKDSPRSALSLRIAVSRAAQRIGTFPGIGAERPDWTTRTIRFLTLKRFPYVIVYDPEKSPPLILRVAHASRDMASLLAEIEAS